MPERRSAKLISTENIEAFSEALKPWKEIMERPGMTADWNVGAGAGQAELLPNGRVKVWCTASFSPKGPRIELSQTAGELSDLFAPGGEINRLAVIKGTHFSRVYGNEAWDLPGAHKPDSGFPERLSAGIPLTNSDRAAFARMNALKDQIEAEINRMGFSRG